MNKPATKTTTTSPVVAAALALVADRGWHIFPADLGRDKAGKFKKKSHKSAEHSGGVPWGMTTDPEQVKRDFAKWPNAGIGVPTGAINGIFVIEADTPKGHKVDGIAALAQLEAEHGTLPATLMAESPTGSRHYYFRLPSGIKIKNNNTAKLAEGVDVRGDGGMMVAPPSVRGDGVYRWLNDAPIADAPPWLVARLADPVQDDPEQAAFALLAHAWPQTGTGCHDAALTVGGFLARSGRTPDEVSAAAAIMTAGMPDRAKELCRTARDAAEAHADGKDARGYPKLVEDFGNDVAERVAAWLGYDASRHYDPGTDGPQPLGYTTDLKFVLLVNNSVIYASSTQLVGPPYLLGLAPVKFWSKQFPPSREGQSFGAYAAAAALIQACKAIGAYDATRIRGIGVWREGSRIIVNFGVPVPADTEYRYLCFKPIGVKSVAEFETERLYQMLQIWKWKKPGMAMLYLGWQAYSVVCGAVDWRPHMLLIGPPGSGKTALKQLTARLLNETALVVTGISSAAGIRQAAGYDSRQVLMDDTDQNKEMNQVVHLSRMASSSSDPTLRGTPEGQAQRYLPTMTFHFTSVHRVPMLQQDVERIVTLELTAHDNDRAEGERLKRELQHFEDRGKDWFGYCVGNVGLFQPSIDAFIAVLEVENQRQRLTLATLLGAAFVAFHRRAPTSQEAADWVTEHAEATSDHVSATEDRDDAREALDYLLLHTPFGEQRPLGHHIAMVGLVTLNPAMMDPNKTDPQDGRGKYLISEYRRSLTVLYRHSIKVQQNKTKRDAYEVFLKNQAPAINKIFERSRWEGDWQATIARVPECKISDNAVYFPSLKSNSRAVVIPDTLIPEAELGEDTFTTGDGGDPPF
jgi:hypothetical protein